MNVSVQQCVQCKRATASQFRTAAERRAGAEFRPMCSRECAKAFVQMSMNDSAAGVVASTAVAQVGVALRGSAPSYLRANTAVTLARLQLDLVTLKALAERPEQHKLLESRDVRTIIVSTAQTLDAAEDDLRRAIRAGGSSSSTAAAVREPIAAVGVPIDASLIDEHLVRLIARVGLLIQQLYQAPERTDFAPAQETLDKLLTTVRALESSPLLEPLRRDATSRFSALPRDVVRMVDRLAGAGIIVFAAASGGTLALEPVFSSTFDGVQVAQSLKDMIGSATVGVDVWAMRGTTTVVRDYNDKFWVVQKQPSGAPKSFMVDHTSTGGSVLSAAIDPRTLDVVLLCTERNIDAATAAAAAHSDIPPIYSFAPIDFSGFGPMRLAPATAATPAPSFAFVNQARYRYVLKTVSAANGDVLSQRTVVLDAIKPYIDGLNALAISEVDDSIMLYRGASMLGTALYVQVNERSGQEFARGDLGGIAGSFTDRISHVALSKRTRNLVYVLHKQEVKTYDLASGAVVRTINELDLRSLTTMEGRRMTADALYVDHADNVFVFYHEVSTQRPSMMFSVGPAPTPLFAPSSEYMGIVAAFSGITGTQQGAYAVPSNMGGNAQPVLGSDNAQRLRLALGGGTLYDVL